LIKTIEGFDENPSEALRAAGGCAIFVLEERLAR